VVGTDAHGRSSVLTEGFAESRVVRPTGAIVEELWRLEQLPSSSTDDGSGNGHWEPLPPPAGLSLRVFTIPPGAGEGVAPQFGSSQQLFLLTVVSGAAVLILESDEVALSQGDFVVLPGSAHAWRNPHDQQCVIVTAVTMLTG
jgi:quercetin dioxygenase-like cupin family protein